ncbi:hypothetical protein P8452_20743 [Trifolium repens]|nr:hypothetical protein P8452_20743 [Trifolium repens]
MYVRRCLSHQFRISFRRLRQREAVHKEYYKVQCHRNSSIHNHNLTSSVQLMAFNFSGFLSFLKQGILIFIWGWSLYSRWRHCLLHNCTIQLS